MENEEYDSDILMAVGTVVTSYQKKAVVRSHHLLQGHLPLPLQASGQIPGSPCRSRRHVSAPRNQ